MRSESFDATGESYSARNWNGLILRPTMGAAELPMAALRTCVVSDSLGVQQRLKRCSQVILRAMAVREFRNAQLDFTRKLLRCSWALVDNVPGFGVEPIAEIVKRYLTAEISPQVVPDFRKQARIHGREKTCSSRLAPRTPSPIQ